MRQEEILDLIFDLAPPHQGTTVAPTGHHQGTTDKSKQMPHIPTIDIDTSRPPYIVTTKGTFVCVGKIKFP